MEELENKATDTPEQPTEAKKTETAEKKVKKYRTVLVVLVAGILLLISAYFAGLFDTLGQSIQDGFSTIIKVIAAIVFMVVIYKILSRILGIFTKKTGRVGTMSTLTSSLLKYAAILVTGCWVASLIGVDVSTIFASIGVIALIIGFGAESLVADLVTGIFILFENEYNVGDIIEVDGFRGTVKEIGIRTLSLEDNGGNVKIINNSDLKNIINRSKRGSRAVADIDVSYDTDLDALEVQMAQILAEIKEKHPDVFVGDIQYIGVETLGASGITVRCVAEVAEANIFSGRRLLNKELKCAFDKRNISIPFPQMDIHNR